MLALGYFGECLFPQSASAVCGCAQVPVHICRVSVSAVCGCAHLFSVCFRSLRNRSLCTFACMQSTHAHTLAHTYTRTHTHALAVSPPHIRTPSHEPMPAKYLAFKGGDFRDEEMGEGAIGDEKNRTRGGEDSKLCHVVAMSNVDTLQTHEPSSVSARVSIYDAMSNVDTLNPAMQRRRGSRKSREDERGGGVEKRGVKLKGNGKM